MIKRWRYINPEAIRKNLNPGWHLVFLWVFCCVYKRKITDFKCKICYNYWKKHVGAYKDNLVLRILKISFEISKSRISGPANFKSAKAESATYRENQQKLNRWISIVVLFNYETIPLPSYRLLGDLGKILLIVCLSTFWMCCVFFLEKWAMLYARSFQTFFLATQISALKSYATQNRNKS